MSRTGVLAGALPSLPSYVDPRQLNLADAVMAAMGVGVLQSPQGVTAAVAGTPGAQTSIYYVVAVCDAGDSPLGVGVTLTNTPNPTTSGNTVTVTWQSTPGATGYRVIKVTGGTTVNVSGLLGAGVTAWVDNAGAAGTAYTPSGTYPTVYPVVQAYKPTMVFPAAFTTVVGDNPINFTAQLRWWQVLNYSANNIWVFEDTNQQQGGILVPPTQGQNMIDSSTPVTILHVYTTAATPVNGTAAGGILVRGWR